MGALIAPISNLEQSGDDQAYHIPASRINTRLFFIMTLCQKNLKFIKAVYNSNKTGLEILIGNNFVPNGDRVFLVLVCLCAVFV